MVLLSIPTNVEVSADALLKQCKNVQSCRLSISQLSFQSEQKRATPASRKNGQKRSNLVEEDEREAAKERQLFPLDRVLEEVVFQEKQYWERTQGIRMSLNADGTVLLSI